MIANAEQVASRTAGRARSEKMADRRRRLQRMEEVNQRWIIREAAYAAPNPLSILTTVTPAAQLFSIESRAASPPKFAPYPTLVGTAITGIATSPVSYTHLRAHETV